MDSTFWGGIAIGALLSFIASVLANMFNHRITDVISSSRYSLRLRKKQSELNRIVFLRYYVESDRNVILFAVSRYTLVIMMLQVATTMTFFAIFYSNRYPDVKDNIKDIVLLVSLFSTVILLYMSAFMIQRTRSDIAIIEDFENHLINMRERYGGQEVDDRLRDPLK